MDRDNILLSQMRAHADPSQVAGLSRFFKTGPGQYGEGDRFLGIKVPVTRAVVKACWKEVGIPELEACISSEYHEVRLAALLALVEQFRHARKDPPFQRACIDFYLAHTDRINNWDLVDLSCYPLLGEWLLDKDRTLLYDLARSGRTLWEQRIGIVNPPAPSARPHPQGRRLAAPGSRETRQGGAGDVAGGRSRSEPGRRAPLPDHAPHDAPVRDREIP